jgi:S1-C subfamily serine protease
MHRHGWLAVIIALGFGILAGPARADNRVALVIGNGAYAHVPHLPNPSHDAEDVAAALKRTGFQIIVGVDLDQAGMQDAAIRFARAARTADVAMFYYSGHALQFAGVNYMVPIDAELHDEADLRRMTRVDEVVADLQQAKNLRILVLDSCRDNPLADELKRSIGLTRSASIGRGLAKIDSPEGMIVAYATQAGRTAEDGNGRNSPYTTAFLKNVEAKEEIGTIFRRISADVYQTTRQTQLPELSLSLIGEFYLNGKLQVVGPATAPAAAPQANEAERAWAVTKDTSSQAVLEDFIRLFGSTIYGSMARARLEELRKGQLAVATPLQSQAAPASPSAAKGEAVPAAVQSSLDAVVQILSPRSAAAAPAGGNATPDPAAGSGGPSLGFVIDPTGLIATAQRAIGDAKNVTISMSNGSSANADVVGTDAKTSLALLRVKTDRPLKAVRFGDSSKVAVGQKIAAVTMASAGPASLRMGTVAGTNLNENAGPYDTFIGVDVEEGMGGPLFNLDGEVIGVALGPVPPPSNGAPNPIKAFAIPAAVAGYVIDQLRQFGEVRRGWLGVRIQQVTDEIAESLGVEAKGALVSNVDEQGAAKSAGLEVGDIILGFDGKSVQGSRDLPRFVAETLPGKSVEIVVLRKGNELRKMVSLGRLNTTPVAASAPSEKPAQPDKPAPTSPPQGTKTTKILGLDLASLTDRLREHYNLKPTTRGVVVTADASPAPNKKLAAGEVVLEISGTAVASPADVQRRVDELKKSGKKNALLRVTNHDAPRFVAMSLQ